LCDQYPYALVLIEPIKFRVGASFARRSGKFATNPSVLDYLRDTSSKKSPGSIVPGMYLIALVSDKPGTLELRELSLAIRTPDGLVLVVGCSHPGVEHIMQEASAIDPHINLLFGGQHQIQAPDPEVERIVTRPDRRLLTNPDLSAYAINQLLGVVAYPGFKYRLDVLNLINVL
jgi:hypothetical protein